MELYVVSVILTNIIKTPLGILKANHTGLKLLEYSNFYFRLV